MKTIMLAAMATLPFSALAQRDAGFNLFPDNGVYLSAADFSTHTLTDGFNTGQPGYHLRDETFQRTIKVDQPNAPEAKIPLSTLWGERKAGIDYRSFDDDWYRVEHTDRIFIYSKPATLWIANSNGTYANTLYYFSREANSPIYLITGENLKEIYYDQPDKQAQFEQLDDDNEGPTDQAAKLIQLFYPREQATQSTHSAS